MRASVAKQTGVTGPTELPQTHVQFRTLGCWGGLWGDGTPNEVSSCQVLAVLNKTPGLGAEPDGGPGLPLSPVSPRW